MPNYCSNKLTITGPNRTAVLDKIKGEVFVEDGTAINGTPRTEYVVHFDVNRITPRPKKVAESEGWEDWGYENWGCRNVYPDRQEHLVHENSDVITFSSPWDPPLYAIGALSIMFPDNTFLLETGGIDVPRGRTLYKGGKEVNSWPGSEVKSIA